MEMPTRDTDSGLFCIFMRDVEKSIITMTPGANVKHCFFYLWIWGQVSLSVCLLQAFPASKTEAYLCRVPFNLSRVDFWLLKGHQGHRFWLILPLLQWCRKKHNKNDTSSQSYKNFTSEIYKNSAVFYKFSKYNPIKPFYQWIFLVDFTSEFFTEKFTGKILNPKKNCLLVKFTGKKSIL
jgi:hypothetical protein